MEKLGLGLLVLLAAGWLVAVVAGMIAALPYGIPGLVLLFAIGVLLVKVVRDRLGSEEDDYYSKNVEK
jgi:peptidoglycan/LPS O-acetylase OafA/YrhL